MILYDLLLVDIVKISDKRYLIIIRVISKPLGIGEKKGFFIKEIISASQ